MTNYRVIVSNLDTGKEVSQEKLTDKILNYHVGMLVKTAMSGIRLAKLQVIIEDMATDEE